MVLLLLLFSLKRAERKLSSSSSSSSKEYSNFFLFFVFRPRSHPFLYAHTHTHTHPTGDPARTILFRRIEISRKIYTVKSFVRVEFSRYYYTYRLFFLLFFYISFFFFLQSCLLPCAPVTHSRRVTAEITRANYTLRLSARRRRGAAVQIPRRFADTIRTRLDLPLFVNLI